MKSGKRKYLWGAVLGGLAGTGLTAWIGPGFLAWYYTPPERTGFDCSGPVRWALVRLQEVQLGGMIFGVVVGLVLTLYFSKKAAPVPPHQDPDLLP